MIARPGQLHLQIRIVVRNTPRQQPVLHACPHIRSVVGKVPVGGRTPKANLLHVAEPHRRQSLDVGRTKRAVHKHHRDATVRIRLGQQFSQTSQQHRAVATGGLAGHPNRGHGSGIQPAPEPHDVPGRAAITEIDTGHQRLIASLLQPVPTLRVPDPRLVDVLQLRSPRRQPTDTHPHKVGVLAVVRHPLL